VVIKQIKVILLVVLISVGTGPNNLCLKIFEYENVFANFQNGF
jgi:hypothetical protein